MAIERLVDLLSESERERARRFRFRDDRLRAVLGRGMLRTLLGTYLGAAPEALAFAVSDRGKPSLAPEIGSDLEFNLAHSGQWVVIGVTRGRPIGVDVERVRDVPEMDDLAQRFFAPDESRTIRSLSGEDRTLAFFSCWTRKEAYVKARGVGLGLALDRFRLVADPDGHATVLDPEGRIEDASPWSLWSASPAAGYVGAVATPTRTATPRAWYWTGGSGVRPWSLSDSRRGGPVRRPIPATTRTAPRLTTVR